MLHMTLFGICSRPLSTQYVARVTSSVEARLALLESQLKPIAEHRNKNKEAHPAPGAKKLVNQPKRSKQGHLMETRPNHFEYRPFPQQVKDLVLAVDTNLDADTTAARRKPEKNLPKHTFVPHPKPTMDE
jgi:hypothetical protein